MNSMHKYSTHGLLNVHCLHKFSTFADLKSSLVWSNFVLLWTIYSNRVFLLGAQFFQSYHNLDMSGYKRYNANKDSLSKNGFALYMSPIFLAMLFWSFDVKVAVIFRNVFLNTFNTRMMFIGFDNSFYSGFIIIGTLEFNGFLLYLYNIDWIS